MTTVSEVRALLLAAGLGTRLRPLTEDWPKCLMPIGDRPLLEYWLETLHRAGIRRVLVNRHHHADAVECFLKRPRFASWVASTYERELLGTAQTLRANRAFFTSHSVLLIHADNWCQCDFEAFLRYHADQRPSHCLITMMTFDTDVPETCGIVEIDPDGVLLAFHEKIINPPGYRANAAVYLLEPAVLDWLDEQPTCTDFSTQVLPKFIGRIATWHNTGIHRDIGTLATLRRAQADPLPACYWPQADAWQGWFSTHPVHQALQAANLITNLEATP